MVESCLDDWLCRVKELRRLCTLPAAVLALHAWPMIAPLSHGSSAVSRLLIPAILRGHGKMTSHDLYLSVGLQQISTYPWEGELPGPWMAARLRAVACAARRVWRRTAG
jgi:hypothetical protein